MWKLDSDWEMSRNWLARKWGSLTGCVLFTVWGSKFHLVKFQVYILPSNLFFITLIQSFDLIFFNNFQQVHLQAARFPTQISQLWNPVKSKEETT